MHTLSVVVPAYNEESTISAVLLKLAELSNHIQLKLEVCVVDDGSVDSTRELILNNCFQFHNMYANIYCKLIHHHKNLGKGAGIKSGFNSVTGKMVIIQDSDLEYDPLEIPRLVALVLKGRADVVFGSRFIGGDPHRMLFYWHSIGNKFLTNLSNMFTNLNLTDMETCYKLFRREVIDQLDLKEARFGFEPEITAIISKIPEIRIYEVGISYYGRSYSEGKKINWKDGVKAIYCILKYNTWARAKSLKKLPPIDLT